MKAKSALLYVLATCAVTFLNPTYSKAVQTKIVVATFAPDGTLIDSFDAGMIGQQLITSIDLDSMGNFWVGREDILHGGFPNPNDKVVKYTPNGSELLTIKGPMAEPEALTFDSLGNIYVAGDFEASDDSVIFKFDPNGTFLTSFDTANASQPDRWQDLIITSDDRIFAVGDLKGTIAEFSTNGTQANLIDLGVNRRVWGVALNNNQSNLWTFDQTNGPGPDRVNEYTLSLDFVSGFETGAVDVPWDNLQNGSIETHTNGNLLIGAATRETISKPVVHELSTSGVLLNTREFTSVASLIEPGIEGVNVTAFAVTPAGNYVFGLSMRTADVPEPNTAMIIAIAAAVLSASSRRNRKPAEELLGGSRVARRDLR